MNVIYKNDSPYSATKHYSYYLDILQPKRIPFASDDVLYTVVKVHEYRPDLLAFDLYGNPALWWVFQMRNPNAIEDPIWDFRVGLKIYIPKKAALESALGL